jgi:hypothetical protein
MATKVSHRFLALWSVLAVAGGCGQILGISDYEVDPKLGTGAGGEAGGGGSGNDTAGTTSHAGTTTTAGDSSGGQPPGDGGAGGQPVAGNGGAAAGANAGGEAGAGGAGGAPPEPKFKGCDGTPFVGNEAIVRSCILRVGCLQWLWPTETISRCVSQNAQNVYEGTKCTLDATTCDDITACEGKHIEPTFCGSGATAKTGMYCNGNEVVDCDGFVPNAHDCTKEGGTCKDFGVDLGDGTTVDCQLPLPANTCAATTDVEACSGTDYKYQCYGKIPYGSKCTNFAAGCREVAGDIGCYYPLNACTTEGVTCSNNRATWCDGDSKVTFDCGSVGLSCQTTGDYTDDGERQCLAPGCTPADVTSCAESCSGTKLTLCYGGSPVTVDCKDYGFKKCKSYDYDCSGGAVNDCLDSSSTSTEIVSFAQCE